MKIAIIGGTGKEGSKPLLRDPSRDLFR